MESTGSQGIQVGDAVISFIADMTQLNAGVDKLNEKIETGMQRAGTNVNQLSSALDDAGEEATQAGEEINSSMEKSRASIGEARGQAALLGEAFGIHLPRHVRSFVAELPGVGEALQSAFAATAVLFLVEALVKGTEKLTEFISSVFIFTDSMRAADAATIALNKTISDQEHNLDQAKVGFDRVGLSASKLAHLKIADNLKAQLDQINKALGDANGQLEKQESWWKRASFAVTDWLGVTTHAEEEATRKHQEMLNNQTQADKAAAEARKVADQESATQSVHDAEAAHKAWLKAAEERLKTLQRIRDNEYSNAQLDKADLKENIDLNTELNKLLEQGRKIKDEEVNKGVEKAAIEHVKELTKAMKEQGKALDDLERKMAPFASNFNQAFISAATGAESWGKAMATATGSALQSLGTWCQTKMLENLALALENWENPGPYLAAAAEFEAAALACGIAGGEMSGGGGGGGGSSAGGSTGPRGGSIQTTGGGVSSGPSIATTRFADGGLVTQRTMALIGDSPSGGNANEAVMPLDSPEAMAKIAGALGPHLAGMMGGAGGSHTFNGAFFGQLRHSDLKRLTKQINAAVNKGTATLKSTQTMRITRRSA